MNKTLRNTLLKILISTILLYLFYRHVEISQIRTALTQIQPRFLILFFGILFLNTFLSAWKWKLLLQADNIRISLRRLFGSYLIGSFFNLFLPSTIGGDTYRIASIQEHKLSKSFAAVFADRLTGFLALATYGLVASIIGFRSLPNPIVFLVPLLVLLALLALTVAILQRNLLRSLFLLFRLHRITKLNDILEKILTSFAAYARNGLLIVQTFALSFTFQFFMILCFYILAQALQLPIELRMFFLFIPIVTLLESIPISIFGLGLRDAGFLFFFTQVALPAPESSALTLSVLYVAGTVLYCSLGGILFLLRLFSRPDTVEKPL